MPVGFGRAATQRNHPTDKSEFVNPGKSPTFRVRVVTDGEPLSRLLPPGVIIRGEPELQVSVGHVQEAYWLGTRLPLDDGPRARDGGAWRDADRRLLLHGEVGLAPRPGDDRSDDIGWPSIWADVGPPHPYQPRLLRLQRVLDGFPFLRHGDLRSGRAEYA